MNDREEIEERFLANLERVRRLANLYQGAVSRGRGRKSVPSADLLRAAVVLLHATLEDLLRSLAEWKLPEAPSASLERIPLVVGGKSKDRVTLAELAEARDETVGAIVAKSVTQYLERSNFNHPGDIIDLLKRIGIDYDLPRERKSDLAVMMSRRHWIAHRVDRNGRRGPGHQAARSISMAVVARWIETVESVGGSILAMA